MSGTPFTVRLHPSRTFADIKTPPGNTANIGHATTTGIPASYCAPGGYDLIVPYDGDTAWIDDELNIERLHQMKRWWWMVGRPTPPRSLHHQVLLDRAIFLTEQMDMHLVWTTGRMYLKPLPRFLLEPEFWSKFLTCSISCASDVIDENSPISFASGQPNAAGVCRRCQLRKTALGFLFSYVALIRHESDLNIGKEKLLLPHEVDWTYWTTLVGQLNPEHIYENIDERFHYGELRLSRLNKISRFSGKAIIRGYMDPWQQYSAFLQDNFGLLAGVTVYIAIILTAMQVGLSTDKLRSNPAFINASYGFTIVSILAPLIVAFVIFLFFVFLLAYNYHATVTFGRTRLATIRRSK